MRVCVAARCGTHRLVMALRPAELRDESCKHAAMVRESADMIRDVHGSGSDKPCRISLLSVAYVS